MAGGVLALRCVLMETIENSEVTRCARSNANAGSIFCFVDIIVLVALNQPPSMVARKNGVSVMICESLPVNVSPGTTHFTIKIMFAFH